MSAGKDLDPHGGTHARFPSQTHWTLIAAAGDASSPEAQAALNQLCLTYWFPIYAFIRREGNDSHKAKDLTQSFFVHLLRKNLIQKLDREKGRFRSFLCASLKNFLIDDFRAEKRGRDLVPIPDEAEAEYGQLPVHEPDPTKLFDRTWAGTVIKQATERLKQTYADTGRLEAYEVMKGCLTGELSPDSYPEVAAKLEMTKETLQVKLSRFRKEFGGLVKSTVAETVDPADLSHEIQYLMSAWCAYLNEKPGATSTSL